MESLTPVQIEDKLRQCVSDITRAGEAAQDHSRAVRDITSAVQTIAALTRASFSLAGVER